MWQLQKYGEHSNFSTGALFFVLMQKFSFRFGMLKWKKSGMFLFISKLDQKPYNTVCQQKLCHTHSMRPTPHLRAQTHPVEKKIAALAMLNHDPTTLSMLLYHFRDCCPGEEIDHRRPPPRTCQPHARAANPRRPTRLKCCFWECGLCLLWMFGCQGLKDRMRI
jgi:hypothetical protein